MKNFCGCGKEIHKDRKYCSFLCRSSDLSYCNKISKTKTQLYADKEWKSIVEDKKVKTTLENHGVEYPMQNVDLFSKQQVACFKKDKNGLHGYEPYAYPFLSQLYGSLQLGTNYLKDSTSEIKWLADDGKYHHSYPDFFTYDLNTFIEIKSEYTRKLHDYKVMKCKDRLFEMGYGYIICVVKPRKVFTFETYNNKHITD